MFEGWVKLYRQTLENDVWHKPPEYLKIFIYIMLKVNHKDNTYFGRGCNFFNFSSEEIPGVSKTQIYNFLRWAKSENVQILTTQKTTRGVVIKLNNWERFQGSEKDELQHELPHSYKTATTQLQDSYNTINKNDKNVRMKEVSLGKKSDPFINDFKTSFEKKYKEVFGQKPYLMKDELFKLVEIANTFENFSEIMPVVVEKLNNLDFSKVDFKPSANWLLKENHFARMANGEFDRMLKTAKLNEEVVEEEVNYEELSRDYGKEY